MLCACAHDPYILHNGETDVRIVGVEVEAAYERARHLLGIVMGKDPRGGET